MDYRMWKGTVNANENVVPIIIQDAVQSDGLRHSDRIYFVGFNGDPGTEFYLNNSKSPMEIPDSGYFITPYFGERFMPVFSLSFAENFDGKIYYII